MQIFVRMQPSHPVRHEDELALVERFVVPFNLSAGAAHARAGPSRRVGWARLSRLGPVPIS